MKKLSISLLGVLAVIFAVTSAFTTQHVASNYRVFGINAQPGVDATTLNLRNAQDAQRTLDQQQQWVVDLSSADQKIVDALGAIHQTPGQYCQNMNTSNKVCLASFVLDAQTQQPQAILEIVTGEFQQTQQH